MRPLELLLHCTLLAAIIARFALVQSDSWLIPIALSNLAIASAHLAIERFRWQMIPAYSVLAACFCWSVLHIPATPSPLWMFALLVIWCFGLLLCFAYPVFHLPKPTGQYRVGTHIRCFTSQTRMDPLQGDAHRMRELMLQIWYPADPLEGARKASYRPAHSVTFRNARFALAATNSIQDAPFVRGDTTHPVLLFVPSWRGQRQECTALAEEFSSHGFVVIGIDHPSLSQRVVFPDGRVRLAIDMPGEDYSSDATLEAFLKSAALQVSIRVADVREVLDLVEQWAKNDSGRLFTGRLDIAHIGIYGFSIGGSTACEACSIDARFRAGLNLGGLVVGSCLTFGPQKPFLFIFDDDPAINPANLEHQNPARHRATTFGVAQVTAMRHMLERDGGYWLRIPGTTHSDLSDTPFFSPFRWLRKGGSAPRKNVWQIISSVSVGFFDQHLNESNETSVASLAQAYPEVEIKVFPGSTLSAKRASEFSGRSNN